MRPTPRAEALLAPLTELLSDAEALLWPSEPFDPGSLRREVTIILGDYEEIVLLPTFARRLAAEAPGVTIRTRSLAADSRIALDRGDADLWITPFDQRWLDLPFETVLEDRWVGVGCARAWPAGERSGERRPRPSLVVRSGPDGALPSGPTFRRHRFADPLDVEHVVSNSAALPFLVAGTTRVAAMPERLARLLADSAGIRILHWSKMDPIRRVVQWHPRHTVDPFNTWVREQLGAVGAELADR